MPGDEMFNNPPNDEYGGSMYERLERYAENPAHVDPRQKESLRKEAQDAQEHYDFVYGESEGRGPTVQRARKRMDDAMRKMAEAGGFFANRTGNPDRSGTPVIYRVWLHGPGRGDVLALFPTIPADEFGDSVMSYAHIGQHGAAHMNVVLGRTRPARPEEAAELAKELLGLGYTDLRPVSREQPWMRAERRGDSAEVIDFEKNPGAKFRLGDRVRFAVGFLRSTHQYAGPPPPTNVGPHAQGVVTDPSLSGVVGVRWDDGTGQRILEQNLSRIGKLEANPAEMGVRNPGRAVPAKKKRPHRPMKLVAKFRSKQNALRKARALRRKGKRAVALKGVTSTGKEAWRVYVGK